MTLEIDDKRKKRKRGYGLRNALDTECGTRKHKNRKRNTETKLKNGDGVGDGSPLRKGILEMVAFHTPSF